MLSWLTFIPQRSTNIGIKSRYIEWSRLDGHSGSSSRGGELSQRYRWTTFECAGYFAEGQDTLASGGDPDWASSVGSAALGLSVVADWIERREPGHCYYLPARPRARP